MRRNFLFFILVIVISLATAPYFGKVYDHFIPQLDDSLFGFSKDTTMFVAGIPFAYIFLIPFVLELFGTGNKKKWIFWSLLPVLLFYLYDSVSLSYLPILASIFSFLLAKLINFIIFKFKHSNPPMVVK